MGIKIAFFDIDGTLMRFKATEVSPRVRDALEQLHAKGIKLFIATGRSPFGLPDLSSLPLDGIMCFNGSYSYDQDGVIFSKPMDRETVRAVVQRAETMGLASMLARADGEGANFYQKELDEYMSFSKLNCTVSEDFDALLESDVYQMMVALPPEQDERLASGIPGIRLERWWSGAVDVIPADCGKDVGMNAVLAHYKLSPDETIAFGDGGNDAAMLEAAGIGIAMGNATESCRNRADYVTDSCEEDGVATALVHFGLIK